MALGDEMFIFLTDTLVFYNFSLKMFFIVTLKRIKLFLFSKNPNCLNPKLKYSFPMLDIYQGYYASCICNHY